MKKTLQSKTLLASLLSLVAASALAADYYVVVPLQGKQELLNGISVSLNNTSLPTGLVGVPYAGFDLSQALQVTGDPAYSSTNVGWSVVAGALPAGLVLTKGVISGVPTAAGEQTFSVRATYKTKTGEQVYKILTFAVTVALAMGTLPQGVVGVAYTTYDLKPLLTVSGDPSFNPSSVTWGIVSSSLPAGLSLKSDGTISGTPTASGTGSVTARASYKGVKGEQTYEVVTLSITVALATGSLPQGVAGVAYPAQDLKSLLTVSGDPSFNPANVTWTVVSNTLPAGLTLKADGTISGTPTSSGTGTLVARASYRGVNGEQTYQVVTRGITVGLATTTMPEGVVGTPYQTVDLRPLLLVTGDPSFTLPNVTWSVVSSTLPAGLTLKSDGTISGTPTSSGTGTLVARASYRGVNGEQTYQVVTLGISVSMTAVTLPNGLVGEAYSYNFNPLLTVTGDPAYSGAGASWTLASGSLPAGLTLNANGTLTGTPAAAAGASFQVLATYKTKSGSNTFTITVAPLVVVGAITADTSVDFGSVSVGQSVTRNFTFKNTGSGAATGATASVTGAGMSVVAPTSCGVAGTPVSVAKTNGTCSIAVKYAPTTGGAVAGAVTESWTGPATGSKSLAISAYGLVDYTSLMSGFTATPYEFAPHAAWTSEMGLTWYWNTPNAAADAAIAVVEFRQSVTVPGVAPVTAYLRGAVDNQLNAISVNGALIGTTEMPYTPASTSLNFTLQPGVNVIGVELYNAGGPAGMALEVHRADGTLLAPVSAWKYAP